MRIAFSEIGKLGVNIRRAVKLDQDVARRKTLPFRSLILPADQSLTTGSGQDIRAGDKPGEAELFRQQRGEIDLEQPMASLAEIYLLAGVEMLPEITPELADLFSAFKGLEYFSQLHLLQNVLDGNSKRAFASYVKEHDQSLYTGVVLPYYTGAETMEDLRAAMVKTQLKKIKDQRVLAVMGELPREAFLSEELRDQAYEDNAVAIAGGSSISQPSLVALMTQALRLKGTEAVLEIGTGSGYQAAILSRLARQVYTIERIPQLAAQAREVLGQLNITNVQVLEGQGAVGLPEEAPFDRIIVTAGCENEVPPALLDQLAEGGKMVVPIGKLINDGIVGPLFLLTKNGEVIKREILVECVSFVPLVTDSPNSANLGCE